MTELEQRIAIAEWEGWTRLDKPVRANMGFYGYDNLFWKSPKGIPAKDVPQYDLNEMHEVEETLTEDQWSTYSVTLNEIACRLHGCGHVNICGYTLAATAAQRREAFLRTIGKWKDSN